MILNPGHATGSVIVLDDSLSFWGGFDPLTGEIIDQQHPQRGVRVCESVLVMPFSRGSAGTPAGVAESLRTGAGPVAIILGEPDVNIAIGAMVADALYATSTPVVVANPQMLEMMTSGTRVDVDATGDRVRIETARR